MKSESVWCKIKVDNPTSITVWVCYRSQAASEKELEELFRSIDSSKGTDNNNGRFQLSENQLGYIRM